MSALADTVGAQMFAQDRASQALGMELLAIGPGEATLAMTVREDMANGFGICHGGLIATLADSAFAFACNARNEMTVAAGFSVDFIAPARPGDRLTAVAVERVLAGRSGVYDVGVRNQRDEVVALFRGKSHRMKDRPVVEGDA